MTPQLRFPEFTDVWQVRKLGDITQINPRVGSLPDDFVYIDLDSVKRGTLLKQNRISKIGSPSRAQRLLSRDDIIYQTVRPYQKNNFYFDKAGDYVASTGYAQIRAREGYYPRFVYTLLHTSTFVNKVLVRSTGTNYPAINSNDLAKVKVHTPSKPEQEKIADFLTAVDERIAVGEKKLKLLETYKRGVMQKIFNQQIRFKDENSSSYPDWEEKKLSDVLKERNTQTPISGEYPLMAFVAYKGVAPKGDRYNREFLVSDAKSKKYKQTQLGDFIYSSNNLETGSIGLNLYGSASISPVYSIFETKDGYSHQFLGAYLTRKKFIYQMVRYRQGVVYGQWRIHESEFLKIEEKFPCTGEQQKIADFLTTLDEKITAENSKLTAARQFKKALLQRMFL